ncbi:MAG: sugar phosphate nucleotidyltransferase [Janthinobacterium lividum]
MTHIQKGVITAAGRGTRQYPASRTVQKELFPLVDVDGFAKPTVQIIAEELFASGLEEICIIANPTNIEPMRRHFLDPPPASLSGKKWAEPLSETLADLADRLTFVVQEQQDGYGHAVFQARDWVGDEPFLITLGDHIYLSETETPCTRQVMDVFAQHGASVSSVTYAPEAELYRYGTLAARLLPESQPPVYEITALVEKPTIEYAQSHLRTTGVPEGQYLVHFGIHAFTPTIFDCLAHLIQHDSRQHGEIQLTSAQLLLLERERYLACEVEGIRCDMGIPEGLIETQIALALRGPFAAQAQETLGNL